jgi:hypothetical protein
LGDAQIFGDGLGGELVVAGNHHGTNARPSTGRHRRSHFGAGGIQHAHQAQPDQVLFFGFQVFRIGNSDRGFMAKPSTRSPR